MKTKINILFVLDYLTIGGAQQIVLSLVRGLDKTKFRISVCTLFSCPEFIEEPLSSEIKCLGIPIYYLSMTTWRDFKTIISFYKILRNERINIVHGHMRTADFWAVLLGKVLGRCATVYTRHTTYPCYGRAAKWQMMFLNKFLANKIIAISKSTYIEIVNKYEARPDKVITIVNGVDTNLFSPDVCGRNVRKQLKFSSDHIVICNTSRLEKSKGYDLFLQVANKIILMYVNVKFLIVGDGPERDSILEKIKSMNLEGKVILTEPRRDMADVMASIDIFFFPPLWGEGLSLSVLEAMASGKPVVASNVGSNNELVINHKTGFLPTPSSWTMEAKSLDAEPFIEKICYLVENRTIAHEMGRLGRELVKLRYSSEIMVKRTEDLFEDLYRKRCKQISR